MRQLSVLILLLFALLAACSEPPMPTPTIENVLELPPLEVEGTVEVNIAIPIVTDGVQGDADEAEGESADTDTAAYPVDQSADAAEPAATPEPTLEPTAVIPEPISPRPADDGTAEQNIAPEAEYVIQPGDGFNAIAIEFGVPAAELAEYNGISDTNNIKVGQVLLIPARYVEGGGVEADEAVEEPAAEEAVEDATEVEETPEVAEEDVEEEVVSAETTPEPTPEEPEPSDGTTESQTYVVQAGDSLTQLSVEFDVPIIDLALANDLRVNSDLFVGQVLIIPGTDFEAGESEGVDEAEGGDVSAEPTTYTVQAGDSLREIAIQFGVSEQAILDANNIDDPNLLFVGQLLIIPEN